jgi:integrase
MIPIAKKKHQHVRMVKGKVYSGYRKSKTYNGTKITITATDAKDWQRKFEERKTEIDAPYPISNKRLTVKELSEVFLRDAQIGKAPKTYIEREVFLRKYINPEIGHLKLLNLKKHHVATLYEKVRTKSLSLLEHTHKVLNRMLQFAIENQICIIVSPISKGLVKSVKEAISRGKRSKPDDNGMNLEEVSYIFKEVQGQQCEIVFHLQLLHGLRISEALGLTWEDINFETRIVQVNQQVQQVSKTKLMGTKWESANGQLITIPKTERSRRSIPLQIPTQRLLEIIPVKDRHSFIYKTKNGTNHSVNNFRRDSFNPLMKRLSLTWKTHDLRKFFGSWHLIHRTDILSVSKWLGHKDPSITLELYAKVISEMEDAHRDKIGMAMIPDN